MSPKMKQRDLTSVQSWLIPGGAAIMPSLAMGMRQSFSLFQPSMIRAIGIIAGLFQMMMNVRPAPRVAAEREAELLGSLRPAPAAG